MTKPQPRAREWTAREQWPGRNNNLWEVRDENNLRLATVLAKEQAQLMASAPLGLELAEMVIERQDLGDIPAFPSWLEIVATARKLLAKAGGRL